MQVYIGGGSILAMGPKKQYAMEKSDGPIELRIFPGANG